MIEFLLDAGFEDGIDVFFVLSDSVLRAFSEIVDPFLAFLPQFGGELEGQEDAVKAVAEFINSLF